MDIAIKRIDEALTTNGVVNVSDMNLTELPPIPYGIKVLICSKNYLTTLPPLPETLQILDGSQNPLTEIDIPNNLRKLFWVS